VNEVGEFVIKGAVGAVVVVVGGWGIVMWRSLLIARLSAR
jgi:hypothetical protein